MMAAIWRRTYIIFILSNHNIIHNIIHKLYSLPYKNISAKMKSMKSMNVSLENEKRALQLKYLISTSSPQNQKSLLDALNQLYPFSEHPLRSCPPVELFESASQAIVTTNLPDELATQSYLVLTGGLVVVKGQQQFVENRYLSKENQQTMLFDLKCRQEGERIVLKTLQNTTYIKVHNIWISLAKKKHKEWTEDYIKQKLLSIGFFANLSFEEFHKIYKAATTMTMGPGDVLIKTGQTPYHMYIVIEGELCFERKVKFLKDKELWTDVINELQRQEDDTCEQMFNHLVKNPRANQQTFEVIFKLKSVNQNEIICAQETLCEQKLTYDIVSTLKTKLICLKYPDFYLLNSDRLVQIRLWPVFSKSDADLRKDYYYQIRWQDFKEEVKKQSKLNKIQKQRFQDFLRKAVNLSQQKHYYCPHKVGQGNIIDSPASQVSKLKSMTYTR